jgi:hypothetical protein
MAAHSLFGWSPGGGVPKRAKAAIERRGLVTVTEKESVSTDSVDEISNLASVAAAALGIRRVNWPLSCTAVTTLFSSVENACERIKIRVKYALKSAVVTMVTRCRRHWFVSRRQSSSQWWPSSVVTDGQNRLIKIPTLLGRREAAL